MKDKKRSNPLSRYFSILEGNEKARYLLCENLEEKISIANKILEKCHFCERRCGVNRLEGEKGYCGVLESRISSEFIHWGEEPEIIPSYTIFFAGCTFRCVFCQNWDISQFPSNGVHIKPETLANMISSASARNVNWVGGDPTPNLAYILEVLNNLERNIPQVWNSNMYLTKESMSLLDGVIDVYLTDFKYGNDKCAERLSNVRNYCSVVKRNHKIAKEQCEMIIRHLVMPNHLECCTFPILEWISRNLENVRVNVMAQYRPEYRAMEFEDINRRLDMNEFREAIEFARELGLDLVRG
ncbi:MAG: radical SAM protein [Candidatus Altiarchaeales archaeon]|nr:MAG: radical SAM protein [Candidatus Altiarchaeales archaeon]RLI94825.1 MAG: radical SAM protein [Candidatus Altiarchaeales archaeon]